MKHLFLAFFIISLISGATLAQEPTHANSLDSRLTHVNSSRFARIAVYRVCDASGKCWSKAYFQLIFPENKKNPIKCSAEIKELGKDHLIQTTDFAWIHGNPDLTLNFSSHDDQAERDVNLIHVSARVIPEPDCTYSIEFYTK